jgi:hypothetical protein
MLNTDQINKIKRTTLDILVGSCVIVSIFAIGLNIGSMTASKPYIIEGTVGISDEAVSSEKIKTFSSTNSSSQNSKSISKSNPVTKKEEAKKMEVETETKPVEIKSKKQIVQPKEEIIETVTETTTITPAQQDVIRNIHPTIEEIKPTAQSLTRQEIVPTIGSSLENDSINGFVNIDSNPIRFKNCTEAKAAGYWNITIASPAYAKHLDRDNDGLACER